MIRPTPTVPATAVRDSVPVGMASAFTLVLITDTAAVPSFGSVTAPVAIFPVPISSRVAVSKTRTWASSIEFLGSVVAGAFVVSIQVQPASCQRMSRSD